MHIKTPKRDVSDLKAQINKLDWDMYYKTSSDCDVWTCLKCNVVCVRGQKCWRCGNDQD